MIVQHASCPNCGSPIPFRPGTVVSTCQACGSAVARVDVDLELIGKVATLVDTNSPLAIGVQGRWNKRDFIVVGRTQLQHAAGGVWDEWYLAFEDGAWGWLAEAQGKLYLTFEQEGAASLPPRERFTPGSRLAVGEGVPWTVQEVGRATVVTAEGELPYRFKSGEVRDYVDLTGAERTFATIDYSYGGTSLFVGRETTLGELGVTAREGYSFEPKLSATSLSCPHCGGALTLKAPDQAQRVTCPWCDSLLDASRGTLRYLQDLEPFDKTLIRVPLSSEGTLGGVRYVVLGFMARSCIVAGDRYQWSEYLLYARERGFRWLMESDGHWTFLEPVPAADVQIDGRRVHYRDDTYRKYQQVIRNVEHVRGEFYWRVTVGEETRAADYVHPPEILSVEFATSQGEGGEAQEVNWSHGIYMTGQAVWEAFQLKGSPPMAVGVAPNQPSPYGALIEGMWPWMKRYLAVVAILTLVFWIFVGERPFFFYVLLTLGVVVGIPIWYYIQDGAFEHRRWENSMPEEYEQ